MEREKIKYGRKTELNRWQNDMEVSECRVSTWQCLEESKHFLSPSSFNLYIIDGDTTFATTSC